MSINLALTQPLPKGEAFLAGVVILAGGESSRMGSPKALLTLPTRQTLLDFHIENAKLLNVPILIADNGKNFANLAQNVVCIADFIPTDTKEIAHSAKKGNGALTAIAGAMAFLQEKSLAKNAYLLVISCDSLLGANQVFNALKCDEIADVSYFQNEKDYPLLGLYRLDLLPLLKTYLDNDNRSVMKFLSQVKSNVITMPDKWRDLANFNTPEEFNLALATLSKSNP